MVVHDGVVEVKSLEVVEGRSNDTPRHRRLELQAEVEKLPLEEIEQELRVRVGKKVDGGRLVPGHELVVGGLPTLHHLLLALEGPELPVGAAREHSENPDELLSYLS